MNLVQSYVTKNPCYQYNVQRADSRYITFQNRGPLGLMLHSVGCSQPSAMVFINRWNSASYNNACVHGFIDANSGTIYQCLPWNYRGWHGAGSCNNTHIGVEMCESAYITYTSGSKFTIRDKAKAQADCKRAYNAAVELFTMLCETYKLDPSKICSHKEGHTMGIASDHGDPEHYWRGLGMSYTMDTFRADVRALMKKHATPEPQPKPEPEKPKEEIEMTKAEVQAMITETVTTVLNKKFEETLGKYIAEAKDIPHEGVKGEVRELLDMEVINGGTAKEDNPDDIYLPYNVLRALVVAKRYVDAKIGDLQKQDEAGDE